MSQKNNSIHNIHLLYYSSYELLTFHDLKKVQIL